VVRIEKHTSEQFIDSSALGSRIIRQIESDDPDLLAGYSEEQVGSLFGMTLWNVLARGSKQWYFLKRAADPLDELTGTEYFPRVDA
jgi:hypothetical protein